MEGLVTKSKKIFKKSGTKGNDLSPEGNGAGGDFSSGEDDDLIVIGKNQNYGTMGTQFEDINELNGEKIIKEDKYYREFKKTEGKDREGSKQV